MSGRYDVPTFCREALCITDDPILASIISSYFCEEGEYFCLLEAPRMRRPDWVSEIRRKTNVCAILRPRKIILAGLSSATIREFKKYFNDRLLIIINSAEEINNQFAKNHISAPKETLKCRSDEIIYGLMLAKTRKAVLEIENSTASVLEEFNDMYQHIDHRIFVDDLGGIIPSISANYAFAVGASIAILPPVSEPELQNTYQSIKTRQISLHDPSKGLVRGKLVDTSETTPDLRTDGVKLATFITSGMPYGHFIHAIPTTHLLSKLDLGRNIFNGISYAQRIVDTRIALITDPGSFPPSECDLIVKILKSKNIVVKEIRDKRAKAYELRKHMQFYPYDLLYIASHAGEMSGEKMTISFPTKDGTVHKLVAEIGHTLSPTGEGSGMGAIIEVMRHIRPLELDGFKWGEGGKQKIDLGSILEEFTKLPESKWDILQRENKDSLEDFVVLMGYDGEFTIATGHIAGSFNNPIVFNNACSSFYNFSAWFIFSGARGYIGTLDPVADVDAKGVATYFFEHLSDDTPLCQLLWEAQNSVYYEPEKRTYLHVGCHFNRIISPKIDMSTYESYSLTHELSAWVDHLNKQTMKNNSKNIERVINFLRTLLSENRNNGI